MQSVTLKIFRDLYEPDEKLVNLQRLCRLKKIPGSYKPIGRGWRVDVGIYYKETKNAIAQNRHQIEGIQEWVDNTIGLSAT